MLDKLTKAQEAKMQDYVKEGLEIGLSTAPLDKEKCMEAADLLYKCAGLTPTTEKIFARSPVEALKIVRAKTDKFTEKELFNGFRFGNQDINWIQFYKFFQVECKIKNLENIEGLYQMALHCGWYLAFDTTIVICERPVEIHRNASNQLHKDMGACLSFSDGFSMYYLNGVAIPKEYVLAESKNISVNDVMKESNVEIRRELLRKIGLERFVQETAAEELDRLEIPTNGKKCVYQLLRINLTDGVSALVLKMDNPSINAMHVEGVEDTCKTVKEALAWRNGFDTYQEPLALT